MRLLLIHPEARVIAGAETMLIYFLKGLATAECETVVAVAKGSKLAGLIPAHVETTCLEDNGSFSLVSLKRQLAALVGHHHVKRFDLIHGWSARDWELTSLLGWKTGRPTVGTLHDHPQGRFISRKRQRLMRWCARWGLQRIICVSRAVESACIDAGYPANKLSTIHNGLPEEDPEGARAADANFRLGFLGVFSERKGLKDLFAILQQFAGMTDLPWAISLAGAAPNGASQLLLKEIRDRYEPAAWWGRVHWCGWVDNPSHFLRSIDLLLVPSSDFDPFPTVLLEAGQAGIPVLAADVGGVSEIVVHGQTGWLYPTGNWRQATEILAWLSRNPSQCRRVGQEAQKRIRGEFSVTKMVADYQRIHSTLVTDV